MYQHTHSPEEGCHYKLLHGSRIFHLAIGSLNAVQRPLRKNWIFLGVLDLDCRTCRYSNGHLVLP